MDTTVPVLVLRLDHYGALGIFRSLGRWGVTVHGLDKSAHAPAFRSRYCRGRWLWDLDAQPAERSVEQLLALGGGFARRPILLPSNDETALFVAENAARLRQRFLFQDNDAQLVRTLYDKRSLYGLARKLGIPTAETAFPTCREEVRAFAGRFPVVLKASDGIQVARRSGEKMVIAHGPGELLDAYDRLQDPAHQDLMLQEYIPGGEDAQWMFNGYFDAGSECLFGITGRKLRQTPPYTGMTSLGVCLHNPEVEALTRAFMKSIGYRGILDIGYRFDARDGTYKVLDVNPRVGATFRLFTGSNGLDVVRALYLDLSGQAVPPSQIQEGRKWLVEDLDLISSVKYARDRRLGLREWIFSFAGVREGAWFAHDDLAPFAGMLRQVAVRRPRRRTQRRQVARLFAESAEAWSSLYRRQQLEALIYQERHAAALSWVDDLGLPRGARVLEVGCGPGVTAVALAQRGYRVEAVDAVAEMIALTHQAAEAAGVQVDARIGDVHALALPERRFDLVIALGVLPWLDSEERALAEMARVLRPEGHLIATADNRVCLSRLLDPRVTPHLAPLRAVLKRLIRRSGDVPLVAKRHDPDAVDALLRSAGLEKLRDTSIGFGPFSLFGRRIFDEAAGIRVHHALQRLASQDWPLFRSRGAHYAVLARKWVA